MSWKDSKDLISFIILDKLFKILGVLMKDECLNRIDLFWLTLTYSSAGVTTLSRYQFTVIPYFK